MLKHIFTYSFFILIALDVFFGNISSSVYANEDGDGGAGGSMNTVSTNTTLSEAQTNAELERASNEARANDPTWEQAAVNDKNAMDNALKADGKSASDGKKVTTIVSESVPGADCKCIANEKSPDGKSCTGPVTTRKYECTTDPGLDGFQKVFAKMIRFVINIVMLLGVLAVVGLGIAWSFAGGDDVKMKSTLKTWAINIVIGFIILFMFRYILLFLAPWIYR